MKASLVAYDFRELHKKSELKIVNYGYVRACPKEPATQIWSLEILGVNSVLLFTLWYFINIWGGSLQVIRGVFEMIELLSTLV
jgi:hypothetical protein